MATIAERLTFNTDHDFTQVAPGGGGDTGIAGATIQLLDTSNGVSFRVWVGGKE
jgi:hypothetical protein